MGSVMNRVLVVLCVGLALTSCATSEALEVGESAVDIALTDITGKVTSLAEFKGKVIILDFFADWCPPCRQEIPDFIALQNAYGEGEFAMVGVAVVSAEDAARFAQEVGINYPVLVDDVKVTAGYGPIRSIPTTFIIDKEFKVARKYIGYRPRAVFENDIKALLGIGESQEAASQTVGQQEKGPNDERKN